jgi:tyrosine phenol-lyase
VAIRLNNKRPSRAEPNKIKVVKLVRIIVPPRVYTQAHMDVVAESIERAYRRRRKVPGLNMVYEPKYLRFFQARFKPLAV